ncbi:MAG TPA: GNAT family N-acetyltransferase [Acidimicrobiia bacterium]|nr:GNAT family N-acetyltransferase [Acidimicrobiia bacterium]
MTVAASFFATHTTLPAIVEAGLEGRLGSIARDGDAARLTLGCYEVFGGDAGSPGARRLIAGPRRRELVYGNDPAWRAAILEVRREEVDDRPMIEFDADGLDRLALASVASSVAPGFALRRLDLGLAEQLDSELEPHGLQVFPSARDLVEHGLGFGAVTTDGVLACAATSYTLSSRYLEVAIATRSSFRGRGLAMVVAAALMGEALARNLVPCWSASNPVSKRLAERLGYRPAGECEVLLLR